MWSGAIACAPTLASLPAFSITMSCARRLSSGAMGLPRHVLRPRAKLVAHHGLRGAAVRVDHAGLIGVAAVVAMEAHPVAAVGGEPPLTLGPVLEVIGVDHRGRRVDQVVVPERSLVDRLGRALEPEVPDLGQ